MGFGIWKKIKQGVSKLYTWGKKTVKKAADFIKREGPKFLKTTSDIVHHPEVEKMIEKTIGQPGVKKIEKITKFASDVIKPVIQPVITTRDEVNFKDRTWSPVFKN